MADSFNFPWRFHHPGSLYSQGSIRETDVRLGIHDFLQQLHGPEVLHAVSCLQANGPCIRLDFLYDSVNDADRLLPLQRPQVSAGSSPAVDAAGPAGILYRGLLQYSQYNSVIAPGYEPEALEILKSKKNGNYNVIQIDPDYEPEALERKQVFGITFEQGHNNLEINRDLLEDIVTENRELPDSAKIDLMISLITLKYTQSNSVCYAKDGQAIGIGAGQQSRIHCTRLAGNKADIWYLRQHPKVMNLPWKEKIRRADRDNTIDVYISDDYMDVLADGVWEQFFTRKPEVLTREEKRAWLDTQSGVALGSDAFFPFGDNIERAHKSGVSYIAQPGGSVRDDHVIDTCDKYDIAMAFTGIRLFHH